MPVPPAFEQSDKAWYSPTNDVVGMPARGLFHSSEEYYVTEFHELAHSTGHAKRLHRENFDNPVSFGSESYSKEELIAEMTAAMLCGIAGIEQRILENSAAYLKTWIARLKSDLRLLVPAASQHPVARDFSGTQTGHTRIVSCDRLVSTTIYVIWGLPINELYMSGPCRPLIRYPSEANLSVIFRSKVE
jgi:antirestriction protein ArdC